MRPVLRRGLSDSAPSRQSSGQRDTCAGGPVGLAAQHPGPDRPTCASTPAATSSAGTTIAPAAGFVHWADHHYAVGKKQWTWGTRLFGHAWNRNLSDDAAAYIELMAGVFTDNQPDFSSPRAGRDQDLLPVLVSHRRHWADRGGEPGYGAGRGVEAGRTALHFDATHELGAVDLVVHDEQGQRLHSSERWIWGPSGARR